MLRHVLTGLVLILLLNQFALWGYQEEPKAKGLFAPLKIGQPVSMKDLGSHYQISLYKQPIPTGYKVKEIGSDYLVLEDIVGVIETRIPVDAIKSIVILNSQLKKLP